MLRVSPICPESHNRSTELDVPSIHSIGGVRRPPGKKTRTKRSFGLSWVVIRLRFLGTLCNISFLIYNRLPLGQISLDFDRKRFLSPKNERVFRAGLFGQFLDYCYMYALVPQDNTVVTSLISCIQGIGRLVIRLRMSTRVVFG